MASAPASRHAMPEHWTELIAAKRQRQRCSDDLRELLSACATNCGKADVTDCATCYGNALDRMRKRYTESQDREWFTQRKAFLQELEGLFQDAKEGARTLESIEVRIESEKEAWYRWVLRKYPEFIAVSERGTSQEELRSMLDNPDRPREELLSLMLDGIGRPAGWPASVETFADKVTALEAQGGVALKQLYIGEFFTDQSSSQVLDKVQRYLERYRASEGMSLEDVMDGIAADMRESRNTQPQRVGHQRRLDELRRAKKAFEQDKMQVKSRMPMQQASAARPELRFLPACHMCRGAVDRNAVLSCSLCQVTTQLGGDATLTVYCTQECHDKGHDDHVEAEHACEAGDRCVQLADKDEAMDGEWTWAVSCKPCWEEKRLAIYCSEQCAAENMGEHCGRRHGATTATMTVGETVPWTEQMVEQTLTALNPGLAMSLLRDESAESGGSA